MKGSGRLWVVSSPAVDVQVFGKAFLCSLLILNPFTCFAGFNYADFQSTEDLNVLFDARATVGVLRLTPAAYHLEGAVWHQVKQNISGGFTTRFQFQMKDVGGLPEFVTTVEAGADGFAFVIQNYDPTALGATGEGIGYKNIPNSIAVEFDTFDNGPIRWEGNGDPNNNHISVNTLGTAPNNSFHYASLGTTTEIPNLSDGNIHSVKIQYTPGTLSIFIDDMENPVLQILLSIELKLDLDEGRAYLGFTSSTGAVWETHDILNWSFNTLDAVVVAHIEPPTPYTSDDLECVTAIESANSSAELSTLYRWVRNGIELTTPLDYDGVIHSVTGPSLSHHFTNEGDQIHCVVNVSDGTSSLEVRTEDVLILGFPPLGVELSAHLTPEEPRTTDNLECVAEIIPEMDLEKFLVSYSWFRDGVEITDGLEVGGEFLSVTGPTLSNHFTVRGELFRCKVRITDGTGVEEDETNSVTVLNTPPTTPIVRILPGNPTPSDGLAVYIEEESFDADGDDFFYVIEWYESLDAEKWSLKPLISGRRTPPYLQGQPEISKFYTQMAEFWRVDVTPIETWTLTQKGPIANAPTGTNIVYVLPDLGGDHFVNSDDLNILLSHWRQTKGELPDAVKPLFFENEDLDSSKVGIKDLLNLGIKGWYRGN